ncbi:hypothetical protein LTS15_001660 [Exophiala xenobiotica]|nr:hypothetical protein LTS15_001660 [Exophiala xenobiotica]
MRNWRRNNQFEKRAAEARAERGEMILAGRTSDDIPFGIRALAEDPDVEGVWNSRTHTPLHCHTPQPGCSVASLRPASQPKRDPSASSIEQAAATHNELKSPNELEPLANSIAGLDGASTPRTRSKKFVINYQGPYSRSEAAEFDPGRNSNTTEPRLSISPSKMHLRPITDRPSIHGRKFVIGNGRKTIYGPHRREAQSEVNPLERMEAHRRFHAAESGQLLPRSRRRHTDLVLTTPLAPSASDSEDSDSSSQYMSWPRGTANISLGKQLSRMAERMEGPKPVPFRAFVESLPTTKPPPSAWTGKTQARVDAKLPASSKGSDTASKVSMHTPKSSISSTTTAPTSPTDSVSIPNIRTRKINDGFEVLPAGTLEKGPNVKEFGLWPENQSVSKKPKKLQKRSRSSSGSRRSSMESRRFSGESFRLPIF